MTEYLSMMMHTLSPLEELARNSESLSRQAQSHPEVYYWLWLAEACGFMNEHAREIIEEFHDAKGAYEARETTKFCKLLGRTNAQKIENTALNVRACGELLEYCENNSIHVLYPTHPSYPKSLCTLPDLPLVLYATGSLAVLTGRKYIGMVGTRRPTDYGISSAKRFGDAFAKAGAVIVSGLADGLDGASHSCAVENETQTIAVFGTSIERTFPTRHKALRTKIEKLGGLCLSEYPPFYPTAGWSFPPRNRIIAGLSDALVVMEARAKSGTLITVRYAEKYKKVVFAVPGSVFSSLSEGTNGLLAQNRAKILVKAEDVLEEIGTENINLSQNIETQSTQNEVEIKLSPEAQKLLKCIGAKPMGLSEVCAKSAMPMGVAIGALSALELAGKIIALPGRQYVLK